MAIGALVGSWTAKTIVKQIAKKFPKFAPYIDKAEKAGFLAPSILKSLMGKEAQYQTEQATRSEDRKKTKRNYALAALGLVGGAGLGAAKLAGRGAAAATQAGQQPILGTTGPTAPNVPPAGGGGGGPSGGGSPLPVAPNVQRTNLQTGVTENLPKDVTGHQNYPAFRNFVQKHAQAGHSPEEIESIAKQSNAFSNVVQDIEKNTGKPLVEGIRMITGGSKPAATQGVPTQATSQPKVVEKGIIVNTPMGPGEVHKTHGDNAYVEINGKLKKVPLSEAEPPSQDMVNVVNDLLKIPEVDRSSNVAAFGYNPERQLLIMQFHDGKFYTYHNVTPDIIESLKNKDATPVTSGENQFGAWNPDDPHGSLGAALDQFIKKDPRWKKAGKGQPPNPNYFNYETGYDYWHQLRRKRKK
jgi:hypothetical protein